MIRTTLLLAVFTILSEEVLGQAPTMAMWNPLNMIRPFVPPAFQSIFPSLSSSYSPATGVATGTLGLPFGPVGIDTAGKANGNNPFSGLGWNLPSIPGWPGQPLQPPQPPQPTQQGLPDISTLDPSNESLAPSSDPEQPFDP